MAWLGICGQNELALKDCLPLEGTLPSTLGDHPLHRALKENIKNPFSKEAIKDKIAALKTSLDPTFPGPIIPTASSSSNSSSSSTSLSTTTTEEQEDSDREDGKTADPNSGNVFDIVMGNNNTSNDPLKDSTAVLSPTFKGLPSKKKKKKPKTQESTTEGNS